MAHDILYTCWINEEDYLKIFNLEYDNLMYVYDMCN